MKLPYMMRRIWPVACAGLWAICSMARAALPIEHWVQDGVNVYLVRSPGIAMVDFQIDVDAGGRRDPSRLPGRTAMMASQLDSGIRALHGSGRSAPALDENQLGEAWADLGASFGAHAGADRLSFTLRSLTAPDVLEPAVELAARQMAHPAFPAEVWARDQRRTAASLREAETRPATQVGRAFNQAVYGEHPYGWRMTQESLARIGVADLVAAHEQALSRCGAKVSVVGALDRVQTERWVSRLLTHWPQKPCESRPVVPEVAPLTAAREVRIPFDSAQAHVMIGQPGHARKDPDFLVLSVGNYILGGGGFNSRLTEEIREKRGLTYGVYSTFIPGLHAGAFMVSLQTRPDQAEEALKIAREVVSRFVREGPTEAEMAAAKANLLGGFALRIDSNRKLLDNVANIAWNQLPLDYLDTWQAQVQKMTAREVQQAMARVLQPERMVTVVLGAAQK